ncbi:SRPBCC domain-containing protein [Methanolobus psychrotolerans]|uniref:SRPBCC domain-containing protein n=1 Tax=Methanolobus psychrotolerans TaxID=1874706 RepID=UPI000B915DD0|nr:SRPBCC domain-containing protein [Methanolobus psychrotolerans]
MHKICTDIIIEAPINEVWDLLTDFDRFEIWNPFITSIKGKLEPGSKLDVHMQPTGMKGTNLNPVITKVEPVNEYRWTGHLWFKGIFDGEHVFRLEELENNRTRLIQCERFRGILAPLILYFIGEKTREGFENMNASLKKECEKINGQVFTQNVPLA